MPFKRADRVAGLLQEEISKIIQLELKDPRLGFVTVTGVRVSDDLRNARVHVGVLGTDASQKESLRVLAEAASFIRGELASRIPIRRVPALTFHLDLTAEQAARIDTLLRTVRDPGQDEGPANES